MENYNASFFAIFISTIYPRSDNLNIFLSCKVGMCTVCVPF